MTSLDDAVTSQSSSKHIIGYIFGSIYRRDFKLSLYDIMSQGPSYVTLALFVDHGSGLVSRLDLAKSSCYAR